MNKYITFNELDKKLWIGVGALGLAVVIMFSVFTTTSPFFYLTKYLAAVLVMFAPGYVIMKLFLDHVSFSDYPIGDKAMLSFGLSMVVMIIPYFLTTYIRPWEFNTDERGMDFSGNFLSILLVLLVIGGAFGYKHYLLKKKGEAQ